MLCSGAGDECVEVVYSGAWVVSGNSVASVAVMSAVTVVKDASTAVGVTVGWRVDQACVPVARVAGEL
jgi:hypothetical protein